MNNIFVGNLSFEATRDDVIKLFEVFGTVAGVLIMNNKKGKSIGYGFVDMPNEVEKSAAITALATKEFMGRVLSVSAVVPKAPGAPKSRKFKPAKKEYNDPDERPAESQRWAKRGEDSNPYRRNDRDSKPSSIRERTAKPYKKFDGPAKPYAKPNKDFKPFQKDARGAKPYRQDDKRSKPELKSEGGAKPYRRDDRESKSWDKRPSPSASKPAYAKAKPAGDKKRWVKKDGGPKTGGQPHSSFKKFYKTPGASQARPKRDRED